MSKRSLHMKTTFYRHSIVDNESPYRLMLVDVSHDKNFVDSQFSFARLSLSLWSDGRSLSPFGTVDEIKNHLGKRIAMTFCIDY